MIDQTLVDANILHAQQALNNLQSTPALGLWRIENVLTPEMLDKLRQFITDTPDSEIWHKVEGQEKLNRKKITWHPDSVIEELHIIFESLTESVNKIFLQNTKNFLGVSVWKDWAGYTMGWNTDNPIIDVSMQLYLFDDALPHAGTVFKLDGTDYLVPYISNSGYVCNQTLDPKLLHKPAVVLDHGQCRYSIYSVWSRLPKHTTNSN